ncbi:MAG: glycosyltransferase [Candidatus Binatia bacterium]
MDRNRHKKPAYHTVQKCYVGQLPPPLRRVARVSVVICAYNAERTIDACLASLRALRHPDYEVIVVNDGSTDRTLEIAQRYREVRIFSQPNKGLGAARNVGIANATGEIVAFTDADCVVDPDWLTYLAYKFTQGYIAAGGPNLPPPEASRTAACVAASPGGPTHVLLDEEVAEHIPGCNMAFLKTALDEIGGFDPTYRTAGDDVDLCWRLQNLDHAIGFSPAAMVWHFRRNTVRAYLQQQMGYGKAEAQLYFKHPLRFNMLGQSEWIGRIYGDVGMPMFSRRPLIYHGVFGRGLFQTLYEPSSSLLSHLPFTLEWNLISLVLLIGAAIAGRHLLLASVPLVTALVCAAARAWRAKVDPRYDGPAGRLLITALMYLGPLLRSLQRYLYRFQGVTHGGRIHLEGPRQRPRVRWFKREFFLSYWSETGEEKENLLHAFMEFLIPRKYLIAIDRGWNDVDVTVHQGIWSRAELKVAVEDHGGGKRLFRTRCRVRESRLSRVSLLGFAGLAAAGWVSGLLEIQAVALLVGTLDLLVVAYDNYRLSRVVYHALEIVAKHIQLTPLEGVAE